MASFSADSETAGSMHNSTLLGNVKGTAS